MKLDIFSKNIKGLVEKLSTKPKIAGLQISDAALQYVLIDKEVHALSLKLPPGVIKEGKLVSPDQFSALLKQFHEMINPDSAKRMIPVVISLPSALIYTQSFTVPNVGEDRLEESATLNLRMISPIDKDNAYMSSEIIGMNADQYELLGAFVDKRHVDQYKSLLEEARFLPIAFEFPSLALTRLIGRVMSADTGSILVFQISSDGLDLFIFRNGSLYFDYFRSWGSIQGESREISRALFEEVVSQEVQKVINFTTSRFKEAPQQVFLIAPGFEKEVQEFLEKNFRLRSVMLELRSWSLSSSWYVALGSALRGAIEGKNDKYISLGPVTPLELFHEQRVLDFIWFWRNVVVGVLSVFLLLFGATSYFLINQSSTLSEKLDVFKAQPQEQELALLQTKVAEFNRLVKAVGDVRGQVGPWHATLDRLDQLSSQYRITVDRLEINSLTQPVLLLGRTKEQSTVLSFRNALLSEPLFSNIELPFASVVPQQDGTVGFTIRFQIKQPS